MDQLTALKARSPRIIDETIPKPQLPGKARGERHAYIVALFILTFDNSRQVALYQGS